MLKPSQESKLQRYLEEINLPGVEAYWPVSDPEHDGELYVLDDDQDEACLFQVAILLRDGYGVKTEPMYWELSRPALRVLGGVY